MRLIDADILQEKFEEVKQKVESISEIAQIIGVQSVIDEQPTAYDVDKVVERLRKNNDAEEARAAECDEAGRLDLMDEHDAKATAYREAIRIVKSGGTE